MSVQDSVANERPLVRGYFGTEVFRGVPVAPTFRAYGDLRVNKARPLITRPEYTGTFFTRKTPARGPVTIDGTYSQVLSYEDMAIMLRYGVAAAPAGVTDGEAIPGFTYIYRPHATRNDVDTATVEYGFPGLPFKCEELHFPTFTISADVDAAEAAWMFNAGVWARSKEPIAGETGTATAGSTSTVTKAAAGWTVDEHAGTFITMLTGAAAGDVREIASNTATVITIVGLFTAAVVNTDTFSISGQFTAGINDRVTETIDGPGTTVYFDDTAAGIGTTPMTGRVRSWSVTHNNNTYGKRMMEDVDSYSKKLGKGETLVTGQVQIEFDTLREYDKWAAMELEAIRFHQTGSVIDPAGGPATTKEATIDVYSAYYDSMAETDVNQNVVATWGFVGYTAASEANIVEYAAKVALATLP